MSPSGRTARPSGPASPPQNMATLRNLVVGLIEFQEKVRKTFRDIPVVMRRFARFPEEAVALLSL